MASNLLLLAIIHTQTLEEMRYFLYWAGAVQGAMSCTHFPAVAGQCTGHCPYTAPALVQKLQENFSFLPMRQQLPVVVFSKQIPRLLRLLVFHPLPPAYAYPLPLLPHLQGFPVLQQQTWLGAVVSECITVYCCCFLKLCVWWTVPDLYTCACCSHTHICVGIDSSSWHSVAAYKFPDCLLVAGLTSATADVS